MKELKLETQLRHILNINTRVLVLVLALLMVLETSIGAYVTALYREPQSYRVENQSLESLSHLIDQIKLDQGPKVVFIGDSQTYGSSVKLAEETVPAFVKQELRAKFSGQNLKVYNLALKGYGISEAFFVLNALKEAKVDLLVYNLSLSWINREAILDHTGILDLSTDYYKRETLKELGVALRTNDTSLEGRLQEVVEDNWRLYRYRSLLRHHLLKGAFQRQVEAWKLEAYFPDRLKNKLDTDSELYLPWYEKDWQEEYGSADWKFGRINLSPGNKQLSFYRLMLQLLKDTSMPALIYVSPQNYKLLDSYQLVDYEAVSNSIVGLQQITKEVNAEVAFVNQIDKIGSDYFSDSIHLLAEGNRQLAEILVSDMVRLNLLGE